MKIRLEFNKQDCWIGIFWKRSINELMHSTENQLDIWICLLPMIPCHITIIKPIRNYENEYKEN